MISVTHSSMKMEHKRDHKHFSFLLSKKSEFPTIQKFFFSKIFKFLVPREKDENNVI